MFRLFLYCVKWQKIWLGSIYLSGRFSRGSPVFSAPLCLVIQYLNHYVILCSKYTLIIDQDFIVAMARFAISIPCLHLHGTYLFILIPSAYPNYINLYSQLVLFRTLYAIYYLPWLLCFLSNNWDNNSFLQSFQTNNEISNNACSRWASTKKACWDGNKNNTVFENILWMVAQLMMVVLAIWGGLWWTPWTPHPSWSL